MSARRCHRPYGWHGSDRRWPAEMTMSIFPPVCCECTRTTPWWRPQRSLPDAPLESPHSKVTLRLKVHLHEAAGGGVVLAVLLQVGCELRHACRQLRDLHLRGSGVRLDAPELRHLGSVCVDAAVPRPATWDTPDKSANLSHHPYPMQTPAIESPCCKSSAETL